MSATTKTRPVTKTALILSDTWTMLVMHALWDGPQRFCELERTLEGISTRTLTLKLKRLEAEKMIKKSKDGSYAATEKGVALKMVGNAMRAYGEKFL
jgi:DNA-binding HxlR family transcriptional regulator